VAKYEDLRGDEDSLPAVTGRAWVFGDAVSAEQILSIDHLDKLPRAARLYVMAALDPRFARSVAAGDFIVAGLNFAAGAAHRNVPAALKALALGGVIARSFGDTFLHAAFDIGLPALAVEETAAIKNGDRLRVDVEASIVANLSSGDRYVIRNLDDHRLALLRAGGTAPAGSP